MSEEKMGSLLQGQEDTTKAEVLRKVFEELRPLAADCYYSLRGEKIIAPYGVWIEASTSEQINVRSLAEGDLRAFNRFFVWYSRVNGHTKFDPRKVHKAVAERIEAIKERRKAQWEKGDKDGGDFIAALSAAGFEADFCLVVKLKTKTGTREISFSVDNCMASALSGQVKAKPGNIAEVCNALQTLYDTQ